MEQTDIEHFHQDEQQFCKKIIQDGKEVDIFLENCSSLYNLILDSLHNLTSKTISCECLEEMTTTLGKSAEKILAQQPDAENSVLLRLNTICCAMEQLRVKNQAKLMSGTDSDTSSSARSSTSSSAGEMRSWLHEIEKRLKVNEKRIMIEPNLSKLLIDQQSLQLEIQREGQLLVNRLNQQLREEREINPSENEKKRNCIDAIRKRWHTIYLNSLSLLCRIEEHLNRQQTSEESDSDPDFVGPPNKRARTIVVVSRKGEEDEEKVVEEEKNKKKNINKSESEEDVLPFAESEYERIMDERIATACTSPSSSTSSDEQVMTKTLLTSAVTTQPIQNEEGATKKWESIQQDVGYSSGENSIHEALNTCADHLSTETIEMRRKRIECSPVKAFYRTVQLEDMSDLEVTKAINDDIDDENNLSDSMYVNHDLTFTTTQILPEYDEVMALLNDNDDQLPTDITMSESFNTQWKEIHGQKKASRRSSRISREQMDLITKSSCDASSEESSEGEHPETTKTEEPEDLMSLSFNSSCFDTSSPLKRQRSGKGLKHSSLLLDSLEMDGSFCSTKSEMPPCKSRTAARRKIRLRRMPRSMSDGEQLGVVSRQIMTPIIRVSSPPPTPTARSTTRLLRKLDEQLRSNMDSDTGPEQSDAAQTYEWDEYNPPEKDDSTTEMQAVQPQIQTISNEIMNVDDDFSEHFGCNSTIRLIEESKCHLRVAQKAFEENHTNMVQMSNFELIARSNLRQVEQALKYQSNYKPSLLELSTLQELKSEWADLYESIRSPFIRIMHQVKKFSSTLQEVSSLANFDNVIEIRSKEDVMKALDAVTLIEQRLSCEREELRELVASPTFKEVADDLSNEFDTVSEGYDDAVGRIGKMVESLADVKNEWDMWNERQNDIRNVMVRIESRLQNGGIDNKLICEEMEMCQERMNSLETMCNYLTHSLSCLQNANHTKTSPDFKAELSIYSNALAKLKDRFNELNDMPTSIEMMIHPQEPKPTSAEIHRKEACNIETQTSMELDEESEMENILKASKSSTSKLIKILFSLSFLSALAAIVYYNIFGSTFGPHVTYPNGPPPV